MQSEAKNSLPVQSVADVLRQSPWLSGAVELLDHGRFHYHAGTRNDLRFAMIHVDNAVELAGKMYLIHGTPYQMHKVTRKKVEEVEKRQWAEVFDDVESGLKLEQSKRVLIDYYHITRCKLYHGGNGISVDPEIVRAYITIAVELFERMFGLHITFAEKMSQSETEAEFAKITPKLDAISKELIETHSFERACQSEAISKKIAKDYQEAVITRYRVTGYDVKLLHELRLSDRCRVYVGIMCLGENEVIVPSVTTQYGIDENLRWARELFFQGHKWAGYLDTPESRAEMRLLVEQAIEKATPGVAVRFRDHIISKEACPDFETHSGSKPEEWDDTYRILCNKGERARADEWKASFYDYTRGLAYHQAQLRWLREFRELRDSYEEEEELI